MIRRKICIFQICSELQFQNAWMLSSNLGINCNLPRWHCHISHFSCRYKHFRRRKLLNCKRYPLYNLALMIKIESHKSQNFKFFKIERLGRTRDSPWNPKKCDILLANKNREVPKNPLAFVVSLWKGAACSLSFIYTAM